MKRLDPLVGIAWVMGLSSLAFGTWAFQKIGDFFLRSYVLKYNGYRDWLYEYFRCLIRGESWAVRRFLLEFLTPSLIALSMAVLALAAVRRGANPTPGYSIGRSAVRFAWLCLVLGGFDTAVVALHYAYYFYRYSGFF